MEPKIEAKPGQVIRIYDIAAVHSNDLDLKRRILAIPIFEVDYNEKNNVLSIIDIIKKIQEKEDDLSIRIFGKPEVLIDINVENKTSKFYKYLKILAVCIVLFLGAGIAIINFHEDVNMESSLSIFYEIVTGDKVKSPLILQIPYSLGIGIGMITFFNHILKRKWKKEPSPLDVEMYMYSKNIDEYVLDNTKQNNKSKDG